LSHDLLAQMHKPDDSPRNVIALLHDAQIELNGLLPPWVVDRVCAACKAAQGGAFRAVLDTLPASGCLNVQPPVSCAGDGFDKAAAAAAAVASAAWQPAAGCAHLQRCRNRSRFWSYSFLSC